MPYPICLDFPLHSAVIRLVVRIMLFRDGLAHELSVQSALAELLERNLSVYLDLWKVRQLKPSVAAGIWNELAPLDSVHVQVVVGAPVANYLLGCLKRLFIFLFHASACRRQSGVVERSQALIPQSCARIDGQAFQGLRDIGVYDLDGNDGVNDPIWFEFCAVLDMISRLGSLAISLLQYGVFVDNVLIWVRQLLHFSRPRHRPTFDRYNLRVGILTNLPNLATLVVDFHNL